MVRANEGVTMGQGAVKRDAGPAAPSLDSVALGTRL
jgi:hypothetical protein